MSKRKLKPGWQVWRFEQMAVNVNDRIDNPSEARVERYVGLEHLPAPSVALRRMGSIWVEGLGRSLERALELLPWSAQGGRGEPYWPPGRSPSTRHSPMNQARSGVKRLTERELQVLALIAREHMSNTEIAERLTIEESTVESHVHHILQKLGVHTRNEAARLYLRAE